MSSEDAEYFRARAITERALAISAERVEVRAIHQELARLYEALLNVPGPHPTLRIIC